MWLGLFESTPQDLDQVRDVVAATLPWWPGWKTMSTRSRPLCSETAAPAKRINSLQRQVHRLLPRGPSAAGRAHRDRPHRRFRGAALAGQKLALPSGGKAGQIGYR
jgi:hypothetical protein